MSGDAAGTGAPGGQTKHVRVYGRELIVVGDERSETYRHLPDGADLVDPVLTAFPRHLSRDAVCVDAGAGLGIHTLALSVLTPAGRVVSVEPSPSEFAHLERNLAANRLTNVTACHAWPATCGPAAPFLDPAIARVAWERAPAGQQGAAGTTVDRLVEELGLQRVDLLRIGLDGAESSVLEGARQTLQRWRPVTFVVFNGFATALGHGTLPHVALARLRDTFPYCYVLDRTTGALGTIGTDAEAAWFLYDNACRGPVDDLMCTFEPVNAPGYAARAAAPSAGELTTAVSQREHARTEAAALREANEALRRRNEELAQALDRALADNEALRATMSWRVTSPLRAVRTAVGPRTKAAAADGRDGTEPPADPQPRR